MRFYRFSVLLLIMFLAAGCAEEKHKYVIGVSQCSDDEWRNQLNAELMREMAFHPEVRMEIVSAYDSNDKQISDIEDFIRRQFDAIIVAPNEAGAITPVVEKAFESGIPVILVDRKIKSDKYTAYIGADNYDIGLRAGEYVKSRIEEGRPVRIAEISGMRASTPAEERHNGFSDALRSVEGVQIRSIEADWTYDVAFTRFSQMLAADEWIPDVIFAHNDVMAKGAYAAAVNAGCEKDIILVGVDALGGKGLGVDLVSGGVLDASLVYPTGGYKVAQVAMAVLEGTPYAREISLSTEIITSSNARIMQMQHSQISMMDDKIKTLDSLLDYRTMEYSAQRKILMTVFVLLGLVLILLCIAVYGFRRAMTLNGMLENQKQQIEVQREAKLAFFTNVSHDFRTPLTLISDPVKQLQQSGALQERDRFLLDLIARNVTVLRRLVNQIMDFRKYESGKLDLKLSEFDPAVAVKDWVDSFTDMAWKKHIRLSVETDSSCYGRKIVADMEKLERIIYNLLSNAFKFTPEHGTIRVGLSYSEEGFNLKVSDTGVGMSKEHVSHIFEDFYQISSVHHSGSGIGLALVKAFVDMHDGKIEVDSAVNVGSEFRITLPLKQSGSIMSDQRNEETMSVMKEGAIFDAESQSAPSQNRYPFEFLHPDSDDTMGTVLVIDDNADVRNYVRSILSPKYEVLEARDGGEGLSMAVRAVPDAIICDVMMPVMDGMECCRRLKEGVNTSHIPVMMLTAYAADDQKIEGYESGADSYISKPFSSELLLARLDNLIEGRSRLQSIFGDSLPLAKEDISDMDRDFVGRLREVIEENIDDTSFSVESLGEKMCLSRVQLYRKTKALTGYSPNEYIRTARLKKASYLLATTDSTVSEIAYSVGFSSPSYFAKCYKEYFGTSPASRKKTVG
ncbi:MAG: response regulator [Bacteroidales bacterium]|nr:response regulator [Bacteroidales bacterium]